MNTSIEVLEPEIVGQELAKVERTSGLAEDRAVALRGEFADYYNEIVGWREKAAMVTRPDDTTHQKIAREVRLGLRKVRCEIENVRKALKADSLARGKAIDGFANVLKYLCEPVETKLLEVELYAERQEAARIAALVQDRTAALAALEADPTAYNLGAMDEKTWEIVLKTAQNQKEEREVAAAKAEADRIAREQAEADERARIRAENERLKKEAVEREATAAKERAKIASERARERAAAATEQRKLEAAAKTEREAREKVERQAAADRAAEAARIKAEAVAKAKAERAPDKEKLQRFAALFDGLTIPTMQTASGKRVADIIRAKLGDFEEWICKQVETL